MNCLKFIPDEIDTVVVSHYPRCVVIHENGSYSTAVGRMSSKYCSTPGISSTAILSVTLNISDKLQAWNSKNIVA
ncbi:hypothetical protein T01_16165 [Trichinella spiralis]|uniref:Uncharacterized protein n=1 Tax=Trichinella spiralis TaxID=6334 RepID=A0A0V1BYV3_TRISP|nr:hypothetical protein T01_16165 [Trichinella spiralis]